MPKYINSDTLSGSNVVKLSDGRYYIRTGNYVSRTKAEAARSGHAPTESLLINDSQVDKVFYTATCSGAKAGEQLLTPGGSLTVNTVNTDLQIRFAGTTPGDTGTVVFDDGSTTCTTTLSVNAGGDLVFDVNGIGSGPHVLTSYPTGFIYYDCNSNEYDLAFAARGSFILGLKRSHIQAPPNHKKIPVLNKPTAETHWQVLAYDTNASNIRADNSQRKYTISMAHQESLNASGTTWFKDPIDGVCVQLNDLLSFVEGLPNIDNLKFYSSHGECSYDSDTQPGDNPIISFYGTLGTTGTVMISSNWYGGPMTIESSGQLGTGRTVNLQYGKTYTIINLGDNTGDVLHLTDSPGVYDGTRDVLTLSPGESGTIDVSGVVDSPSGNNIDAEWYYEHQSVQLFDKGWINYLNSSTKPYTSNWPNNGNPV